MAYDAAQRMDRMYWLQRPIYDATRRYYLLGRKTLINGLIPPPGGTVLEVGCGTGWNLIEIARTYPHASLFGFDVSEVMLETASRKIAKAGLQHRITLAAGDATAFSGHHMFGVRSFDRIVGSYVLSMIPDWTGAVARSVAHLTPGGSVHIVDFGEAAGLPKPIRIGLHAWLETFDVTPRTMLKVEVDRIARHQRLSPFYTELHSGYAQYAVLSRN
jgi:S-adenosylmethionine-diacylgycerolhomoserine-N-methlytransferase